MTFKIPLLVTLLSIAPVTFAQGSDEQPRRGKHPGGFDIERMEARADRMFDAADTDGDGMVTEQEFMATEPRRGRRGRGPGPEIAAEMNAEVFAALDADNSGQISAEEFLAIGDVMHQVMKARMFERLDKNGDGVLHRDELASRHERMAALDTDGDGTVSREEARAAKPTAADE